MTLHEAHEALGRLSPAEQRTLLQHIATSLWTSLDDPDEAVARVLEDLDGYGVGPVGDNDEEAP